MTYVEYVNIIIMSIVWSNINLTVKESDRKILKGVGGELRAGELMGIMGPTGCGKTSLLNILAGRLVYSNALTLTGRVLFDGRPIDTVKAPKRSLCYLAQDDILFSHLTVRETLTLAAYFSSPLSIDIEEVVETKVTQVIEELSLRAVEKTLIGSAIIRGVSGGEYKRVLIGKELMHDPDTIFLDEPTSGLDSFQALSVIQSLRTLVVAKGKKVAAAIHQPRSSLFKLFDLLLLLADGGIIYYGDAAAAVEYFRTVLDFPCPVHHNPADFFVDLVSLQTSPAEERQESKERISSYQDKWMDFQNNTRENKSYDDEMMRYTTSLTIEVTEAKEIEVVSESRHNSSLSGGHETDEEQGLISTTFQADADENIESSATTADNDGDVSHLHSFPTVGRLSVKICMKIARWGSDFVWLMWRAGLEIYRNYPVLVVRCVTALFFAVLLSLLYQDINYSQESIQDRVGLMYFLLINQAFGPVFGVVNIFINEKHIVCREIRNSYYRTSSYFVARIVCELPYQALITVIYGTIVYWSVGLNDSIERFLLFLVILILTTFCGIALGFLISAGSPSLLVANAVGPALLIILLLYGGFYINTSSLPTGSEWVRNISFLYWGFQALTLNEFRGESFDCNAKQSRTACVRTGEEVIVNLSFEDSDVVVSISILIALAAGYLALAYFVLLLNRVRYFSL